MAFFSSHNKHGGSLVWEEGEVGGKTEEDKKIHLL